MSATFFNQVAKAWGDLRAGSDHDTRTKSFVGALNGTSDTIASVSAVNITRMDGAQMTVNDLALGGEPVINTTTLSNGLRTPIPPGLAVTVPFVAGTASGTYNVEIIVVTAGGKTMGRDTQITVAAAVG